MTRSRFDTDAEMDSRGALEGGLHHKRDECILHHDGQHPRELKIYCCRCSVLPGLLVIPINVPFTI